MGDDERKSAPFAFLESSWWKDMNRQLCVDGWPIAVVQINGLLSEAKRAYEAERECSAKLVEMLDVMVSECRSHIKMLAEKKVYVGVSWLNKAEALIAEYEEANRDR